MNRGRIPLWLKVVYTLWAVTWVAVYWSRVGPANFLFLCDIANLIVVAAIWTESPLLFSSQATSVLLVDAAWLVDFVWRLVFGTHTFLRATDYMFEPSEPAIVKAFSLFFHTAMPALLLWAVWRLGYDRRGWLLQTGIAWIVLPLSLPFGPELNINRVWGPLGEPQTWMSPELYLFACMLYYPVLLYLPAHVLLLGWMKRMDRPILPE